MRSYQSIADQYNIPVDDVRTIAHRAESICADYFRDSDGTIVVPVCPQNEHFRGRKFRQGKIWFIPYKSTTGINYATRLLIHALNKSGAGLTKTAAIINFLEKGYRVDYFAPAE